MDVKRRVTDEKMKPMMSCTVEPGRISTQKPTRNNCRHMGGQIVQGAE